MIKCNNCKHARIYGDEYYCKLDSDTTNVDNCEFYEENDEIEYLLSHNSCK